MRSFFTSIISFLGVCQQVQLSYPEPLAPADLRTMGTIRDNPQFPHDSSMRTESLSGSCKTISYPSSGGIVLGYFSAVQLDYLNISRTTPTKRSTNAAEEDDLAIRMLRLGAHWWPSWGIYARHMAKIRDGIPYDFHFPPVVNVAYPSSGKGVWVLKFSADSQPLREEDGRKPYLEEKPEGWQKMDLTLTMDEQCDVLKEFGGIFYEKVDDCPDIAKSIPDAIQRGNRYVELLKKMEDDHYVDRWLSGSDTAT